MKVERADDFVCLNNRTFLWYLETGEVAKVLGQNIGY